MFRARNGTIATAWTAVLPEATYLGALSALRDVPARAPSVRFLPLGAGIGCRGDPDRCAERHPRAVEPGGEGGADVAGRGGADRIALPVQHPAGRAEREHGFDRRVEPAAERNVELEIVRGERGVDEPGLA